MMGLPTLNPVHWFAPAYDVTDKVVLVTGAGQGIGRELVEILHARGAIVAVVDIDEAAAERAAEPLRPRAHALGADVADRAGMRAAIDEVVGRFGRLDVVVANAGVTPVPATVRTMDPADFDRVLSINLTGVFNTVHPALDHVVRTRGHVVVVSSCAAFAPGMGGSPYMVSKAAVEQLGRALRVELAASGASAGVAYFGIVETAMTHDMLDADDLGRELDGLLPWPLNVRISAEHAARTIADGIARRAPRTIAPSGWEPYALLRGAVNVVLDGKLAADATVHELVRAIERRR
ncbi:putative oxidoreductase [Nocardia asteroides NBRC 15531]|uniref:Oxidoreductase n=2 Tax=Nocardia asteroides TaxID=1824 RepID=U5ELV8_NOCAS|nr:short-chain dehydrogenase/reductase [Nocardia asteroides]UGT51352.1 short-chain dehydrogenase/reductase [Nocardia asteroides]GAD86074.1 putative oxidoreductase [Nocardia asteroides NBRC 15531]SFM28819.1 NAD(P)-dependent dehydrogenase, short-chain alcohol dehydrogenase family [Nocardia asteroides]VEG35763.1 3-oxoacyl-[acyl-carrier-protein] reductase FabG [Nocardia asteroides]